MLLLLVLVPLVLGDTCPPPSPLYSCATPSLYIMDATNDVDSATINAQIEFMEKKVLPETAADQLLTFLCYGAGRSSKPLSTSYNTNCADLQAVSRQMQTSGGNAYKLKDLMKDIANTYLSYLNNLHVQFFTASADEVDVQDATSYARLNMPNVRFTVVILRSDGVVAKAWSGFPADFVISIPPSQLATVSNLDKCLVAQSCRKSDYCPLFLATTAAPTTTTTTATTTTTTPTTTTTTTTSSTSATTTTAATSNGPQCSCNPATVWVDVMLLFDNSAITGGHELQMMLNYAQESLNRLNIEQSTAADNFHTRMGIVVYSSTATLYSPLGTVNNANFLNIATLPYAGGNDTNLDDALDTAMSEFDGMAHRRNTRKVVIIFASDYIPGQYASPNTTDFINLNGVVIVYNGLPAGAPDSGILGSLASPGYFIRNTDDPIGDKLIVHLCKANCFCPSSLTPFTVAVTGEPTAGCYLPFTQMSNFQLAKNNCKKQVTGGYISQAKSPEKSDFLIDLAGDRSILNGLSWDVIENEYLWEDGTPLGSYQPWNDNGTHTNGIDCVIVWPISQDFPWVRSDCRTSWAYVCEGIPCDSSNYCP